MLRFARCTPASALLRTFATSSNLQKFRILERLGKANTQQATPPSLTMKPAASRRGKEVSDENPLASGEWDRFNEIVYPPVKPGEAIRPAEICNAKRSILYPRKKLIGVTYLVRGLNIDEAIRQLAFRKDRGSHILKELLEQTQQLAVDEHFVEYRSNMFVSDCYVMRGLAVPRLYKGVRRNVSLNTYHYAELFVRLREGDAPRHYTPAPESGHEKFANYLSRLRSRRIMFDL